MALAWGEPTMMIKSAPCQPGNAAVVDIPTLKEVWSTFKQYRHIKEKTTREYSKALKCGLGDWLDEPINSITKEMVLERHRELTQKSPSYANGIMRTLRTLLNFALEYYNVPMSNPVGILRAVRAWNRVDRRRTFIRPHQMQLWFETVLALENVTYRDFLLFLMFTGVRKSEAIFLRWEHIDMADRSFMLRETKNGDMHELPLCDYLYRILSGRFRQCGGAGYVFPGETENGHLSVDNEHCYTGVAKSSGIVFTPHDLRRTYATIADAIGIEREVVKRLLNHRNLADVTAGYIISSVERLRKPVEQIAGALLSHAGLKDALTEATPLPVPPNKQLRGPLETDILCYMMRSKKDHFLIRDVWQVVGNRRSICYDTVAITMRRLCQRGYIHCISGQNYGARIYALPPKR